MTRHLSENDEIMLRSRWVLPKSQDWGINTHEESMRRKEAEIGSQRLAKAIQKYFERRAA